jgi:hypothetical protein
MNTSDIVSSFLNWTHYKLFSEGRWQVSIASLYVSNYPAFDNEMIFFRPWPWIKNLKQKRLDECNVHLVGKNSKNTDWSSWPFSFKSVNKLLILNVWFFSFRCFPLYWFVSENGTGSHRGIPWSCLRTCCASFRIFILNSEGRACVS